MAGDWIKLEVVTPDKPEVSRIADILSIDHDAALGKLVRVWIWADLQTIDGNAVGVTKNAIDRIAYMPGFASAMISVGWISGNDQELVLVGFDKHNGKGAKKRALTNQRVTDHRKKETQEKQICNAPSVNNDVTREEKRILESNTLVTGTPETDGFELSSSEDESVPVGRKKLPFTYTDIQNAYNKICRGTFKGCDAMTAKRKGKVRAMVAMEFMGQKPFKDLGIGFWEQYFTDCLSNPHWCGNNDRGWKANFEFVTTPDNALKILEVE
jgi:hypothetical protein